MALGVWAEKHWRWLVLIFWLVVAGYMLWERWDAIRLFALGGSQFVRKGTIPNHEPCYIVMNHQSLLDIPTVAIIGLRGDSAEADRAGHERAASGATRS